MKIKNSTVSMKGIKPELIFGLIIIDQVMKEQGQEAVITSGSEETTRHVMKSLHYNGCAVDLRSRFFSNPELIAALCREALGNNPDYEIIVESNHFHFEYQPKRKDRLL